MMPLSLSLGSLFEAYVKKVMYTYDAAASPSLLSIGNSR